MTTEIKYKGSVIASPENGQTATLKCEGLRMESDVVVKVEFEEYDGTVRDEQPVTLTSLDGSVITDSSGIKITTMEG